MDRGWTATHRLALDAGRVRLDARVVVVRDVLLDPETFSDEPSISACASPAHAAPCYYTIYAMGA